MPKDHIDYSNTIIYLIFCKNRLISDFYVGHTTNFIQRKHYHKSASICSKKRPIYSKIRETGGWNSWRMIEVARYNCSDADEATKWEDHHRKQISSSQNYGHNFIVPCDPGHFSNQCKTSSGVFGDGSDAKNAENAKNFNCTKCDFICSKKSEWDRHVVTSKHIFGDKSDNFGDAKNAYICEICEKKYTSRNGLWLHNKKCHPPKTDDNIMQIVPFDTSITSDLIMELLKDNKDMKQIIIDQNNTINKLVKNGVTNYSNNTNCNNKAFNLNFFLNETCKDAMNLTDFIDSIKLQVSDLEKLGELGYVEGLSNIITTNLNALDITARPVHCTDKKRETIYIKDDNKWEKEDDNKSKLRKVIQKVTSKNYKLLPAYREKYPGCQYADSKYSDRYNKMIIEAMGGAGNNDVEKEDRIIRNISKTVVIEK